MEKSWNNFWTTGKVEDYLSYRNCMPDKEEKETEKQASKGQQDTKESGESRDRLR